MLDRAERTVTLGVQPHRDHRMPTTAKLSRAFYDKLGDDVANELVGLLNVMDSTYLTELRQLNELNFARFDAKVGQRFAEADAKLEKRFAETDVRWERRFAEADVRWERRFADVVTTWEQNFSNLRVEMRAGFAEVRAEREAAQAVVVKWLVGFLAPTLLGVIGVLVAVLRTR